MSLSRAVVLGVVGGDGSVKISINALSFFCMDVTYRPLGSVCLDQVGVQRMTVDAQ
jgi:hypothetical protein